MNGAVNRFGGSRERLAFLSDVGRSVRRMTDANDRAMLIVVSVQLLSDSMPRDEGGLPASYTVALGLSRQITRYEFDEIVNASPDFASAGLGLGHPDDRRWLTIPNTTIDDVQEKLPSWMELLATAVSRAAAVQEAADALQAGQREEFERRKKKLTEVNRWLVSLRDDRAQQSSPGDSH
jgi:hypothetical protein